MSVAVIDLVNHDVDNQMSGFISKTLDVMNNANFDESVIKNSYSLTAKNIEGLWKRFYPPCMMNLT